MIPRILHHIWVGPVAMPAREQVFVTGWRRLMPDWRVMAWTEATIDFSASAWLRRAYAMRSWALVADFVRLDVLRRHGGVYLDADVQMLRPLDPLLTGAAFLGFQAEAASPEWRWGPEWVGNAVIGAEPGHWLPAEALALLQRRMGGEEQLGAFSGPGVLTAALQAHGLQPGAAMQVRDVRVHPLAAFYSDPAAPAAEAFAVHHWAASWVAEAQRWPLRKKLWQRAVRHLPGPAFAITRAQVARAKCG
ncbi:MAG TPA: glycosyltransferase [Acetobacteraceae bacterium]|nr:glycosyltransferase [Acetobacteraceae bacterium]